MELNWVFVSSCVFLEEFKWVAVSLCVPLVELNWLLLVLAWQCAMFAVKQISAADLLALGFFIAVACFWQSPLG